MNQQPRRIIKV